MSAMPADTRPDGATAVVETLHPGRKRIVIVGGGFAGIAAAHPLRHADAEVVLKFDGGLPRTKAEAQAFVWCVAEWLNRNPMFSPPGRCLACGDRENVGEALLPYGIDPIGHAWLHPRCWPRWHAGRKAAAIASLKAMEIASPVLVDRLPVTKPGVL
jgi:hypothetical protein